MRPIFGTLTRIKGYSDEDTLWLRNLRDKFFNGGDYWLLSNLLFECNSLEVKLPLGIIWDSSGTKTFRDKKKNIGILVGIRVKNHALEFHTKVKGFRHLKVLVIRRQRGKLVLETNCDDFPYTLKEISDICQALYDAYEEYLLFSSDSDGAIAV